jgi:hypothetical protein
MTRDKKKIKIECDLRSKSCQDVKKTKIKGVLNE